RSQTSFLVFVVKLSTLPSPHSCPGQRRNGTARGSVGVGTPTPCFPANHIPSKNLEARALVSPGGVDGDRSPGSFRDKKRREMEEEIILVLGQIYIEKHQVSQVCPVFGHCDTVSSGKFVLQSYTLELGERGRKRFHNVLKENQNSGTMGGVRKLTKQSESARGTVLEQVSVLGLWPSTHIKTHETSEGNEEYVYLEVPRIPRSIFDITLQLFLVCQIAQALLIPADDSCTRALVQGLKWNCGSPVSGKFRDHVPIRE
ncbi:hypothetical protein STEG23_018444, partial [Scotinomys teguina]